MNSHPCAFYAVDSKVSMYRRALLTLSILPIILHHALALNVLAIVSLPLKSHYMAFQTLFRELAIRGHYVTVMNNYPDEKPVPNLTFINLQQHNHSADYFTPLDSYEKIDSTFLHLYNVYHHFSYMAFSAEPTEDNCQILFTNEYVKAHFAKGIKYDVIFVEQFICDCGLVYAGVMYDAPIIGITSHVMLPIAYSRLGIPFNYNTDSYYFSMAGPFPSLYQKTENVLINFLISHIGRFMKERYIREVFARFVPHHQVDVEKLASDRMKMMFVYQHFSLTGARPLAPQLLEIAGIHIRQAKPVPEAIEAFLSKAEHGVIYVSFGSNLKANTMSENKRQEFLNAFKEIPQRVVWKYENASFHVGNENVYTSNWLPQLDILCHPKVVAFVTHGGMLSLSEAAHCGKPVLVIPLFGDQFGNAAAARAVGLGNTLHFARLNADNLASGIRELTAEKMQENAKRISSEWHDRPLSVLDSAIFWTEYVARHGSSPPLLPSQQTSWFESLLLDVSAVIILLILAVLSIVYFIFKILMFVLLKLLGRAFCTNKSKKE